MAKETPNSDVNAIDWFTNQYLEKKYPGATITKRPLGADLLVEEKTGHKIYYEIKSTKERSTYHGQIMLSELFRATEARQSNSDYFFVLIRKGNISKQADEGYRIIPYNGKEFLKLEDMLELTTNGIAIEFKFSIYGIDPSKQSRKSAKSNPRQINSKNSIIDIVNKYMADLSNKITE